MYSQVVSTLQVPMRDRVESLVNAVQARMIECVGSGKSKVSRTSTSAHEAANYHLRVSGQLVRARLALHAGLTLGLTITTSVAIAATVELLHNASLIHDDIQDCGEVRRGQQAVWVRFGVNTAICTGDLLLSSAYAALAGIEDSTALAAMMFLVHEQTSSAIEGQCADLAEPTCPESNTADAVARYEQIAAAKSGALLSLPIELALLAAGHSRHLADTKQAVNAFAIGYQIVDDLNDLQIDTEHDPARATFNIITIYKATSFAEEAIVNAKALGRHHLGAAIEFAARLPHGAGNLLSEHARGLAQLLAQQTRGNNV